MKNELACIDGLMERFGKDRLLAFLAGELFDITEEEIRILEEFCKPEEFIPSPPEDFYSESALAAILDEACPEIPSDRRRAWLDERLLEYALSRTSGNGLDIRTYAEPTKFNIYCVIGWVQRQKVHSMSPEERERRLIELFPGKYVASFKANANLPGARKLLTDEELYEKVGCAMPVLPDWKEIVKDERKDDEKADETEQEERPNPERAQIAVARDSLQGSREDLSWLSAG